MLITSVTTSPPCDLPAIASAVADAAAALLALGVAQASSGGAVSPRLRTHGGERQQQQRKPVRVAVSGGASAWCGATYDGGPPTPTSALSPSSKRRVSSWSKPQSRVDVQAGAIKVVRDPSPGKTVTHRSIREAEWARSSQRSELACAHATRRQAVRARVLRAVAHTCVRPNSDPLRINSLFQLLETTVSGPTWTFEGSIRAALGNNPDTSKGLRKCVAGVRGLLLLPLPSSYHALHVITDCAATECLSAVARAGATTRTRTC